MIFNKLPTTQSLAAYLVFIFCLVSPQCILASEYSPPGFYDVEYVQLDNGLDVIFKHRPGAHTLSLRVWVGIGQMDFPCETRETPHFLEHLLFSGTSKYTEAELEHLVADHGGSWNAFTGSEETVYQMDIYSRYADFAIHTLHEILTDSIISDENVEKSRDIIHREAGGKPSKIRRWVRRNGIGINGTEKAVIKLLPGIDYVCKDYITAEDTSREDILAAYDSYYVPGNMALIIVGDFEHYKVLDTVKRTFGQIPAKHAPSRQFKKPGIPGDHDKETGTFSPLLSADAAVGMLYRTPGYWSEDTYVLKIIEEHLSFRINEEIRINRGLAYAPGTWRLEMSNFGLFSVFADVDFDDIDTAMAVIKEEIGYLADHGMNQEELEAARLKILLRNVQGYEANASFADYYASQYAYFEKNRYFENEEEELEAVTVDDIKRVARDLLSIDRGVVVHETPTLTYTQFYLLIGVVILIIAVAFLTLNLRFHLVHKKHE